MAININPNRINIQPGTGTKPRLGQRRPEREEDEASLIVPTRADVNNIPAPESLATLVRSAIASLRKGVHWDRGTIINLLV